MGGDVKKDIKRVLEVLEKKQYLLLDVLVLLVTSKVCPNTTMDEWGEVLPFLHKKGYLWVSFENDKLTLAGCGYKVPDLKEETLRDFPDKEDGHILYIPFMASRSKDKFAIKKLFTKFFEVNKGIEKIAFHKAEENDRLKIYEKK